MGNSWWGTLTTLLASSLSPRVTDLASFQQAYDTHRRLSEPGLPAVDFASMIAGASDAQELFSGLQGQYCTTEVKNVMKQYITNMEIPENVAQTAIDCACSSYWRLTGEHIATLYDMIKDPHFISTHLLVDAAMQALPPLMGSNGICNTECRTALDTVIAFGLGYLTDASLAAAQAVLMSAGVPDAQTEVPASQLSTLSSSMVSCMCSSFDYNALVVAIEPGILQLVHELAPNEMVPMTMLFGGDSPPSPPPASGRRLDDVAFDVAAASCSTALKTAQHTLALYNEETSATQQSSYNRICQDGAGAAPDTWKNYNTGSCTLNLEAFHNVYTCQQYVSGLSGLCYDLQRCADEAAPSDLDTGSSSNSSSTDAGLSVMGVVSSTFNLTAGILGPLLNDMVSGSGICQGACHTTLQQLTALHLQIEQIEMNAAMYAAFEIGSSTMSMLLPRLANEYAQAASVGAQLVGCLCNGAWDWTGFLRAIGTALWPAQETYRPGIDPEVARMIRIVEGVAQAAVGPHMLCGGACAQAFSSAMGLYKNLLSGIGGDEFAALDSALLQLSLGYSASLGNASDVQADDSMSSAAWAQVRQEMQFAQNAFGVISALNLTATGLDAAMGVMVQLPLCLCDASFDIAQFIDAIATFYATEPMHVTLSDVHQVVTTALQNSNSCASSACRSILSSGNVAVANLWGGLSKRTCDANPAVQCLRRCGRCDASPAGAMQRAQKAIALPQVVSHHGGMLRRRRRLEEASTHSEASTHASTHSEAATTHGGAPTPISSDSDEDDEDEVRIMDGAIAIGSTLVRDFETFGQVAGQSGIDPQLIVAMRDNSTNVLSHFSSISRLMAWGAERLDADGELCSEHCEVQCVVESNPLWLTGCAASLTCPPPNVAGYKASFSVTLAKTIEQFNVTLMNDYKERVVDFLSGAGAAVGANDVTLQVTPASIEVVSTVNSMSPLNNIAVSNAIANMSTEGARLYIDKDVIGLDPVVTVAQVNAALVTGPSWTAQQRHSAIGGTLGGIFGGLFGLTLLGVCVVSVMRRQNQRAMNGVELRSDSQHVMSGKGMPPPGTPPMSAPGKGLLSPGSQDMSKLIGQESAISGRNTAISGRFCTISIKDTTASQDI